MQAPGPIVKVTIGHVVTEIYAPTPSDAIVRLIATELEQVRNLFFEKAFKVEILAAPSAPAEPHTEDDTVALGQCTEASKAPLCFCPYNGTFRVNPPPPLPPPPPSPPPRPPPSSSAGSIVFGFVFGSAALLRHRDL